MEWWNGRPFETETSPAAQMAGLSVCRDQRRMSVGGIPGCGMVAAFRHRAGISSRPRRSVVDWTRHVVRNVGRRAFLATPHPLVIHRNRRLVAVGDTVSHADHCIVHLGVVRCDQQGTGVGAHLVGTDIVVGRSVGRGRTAAFNRAIWRFPVGQDGVCDGRCSVGKARAVGWGSAGQCSHYDARSAAAAHIFAPENALG